MKRDDLECGYAREPALQAEDPCLGQDGGGEELRLVVELGEAEQVGFAGRHLDTVLLSSVQTSVTYENKS